MYICSFILLYHFCMWYRESGIKVKVLWWILLRHMIGWSRKFEVSILYDDIACVKCINMIRQRIKSMRCCLIFAVSPYFKAKLQGLYTTALQEAKSEAKWAIDFNTYIVCMLYKNTWSTLLCMQYLKYYINLFMLIPQFYYSGFNSLWWCN